MERNFYKKRMMNWYIPHIRKVQDYMILLELNRNELPFYIPEWELVYRGMHHDVDKFSPNLADNFFNIEKYQYDKKHNIKNNLDIDNVEKGLYDAHYSKQRHHTDYHKIHANKMSNLDLCEMACDGLASTEKYGHILCECLDYYRERKNDGYSILTEIQHKEYVFLVNFLRLLKIKEKYEKRNDK